MNSPSESETADNHKPLKILIIQLARLGDNFQSFMGLRAAKQLYPQLEISFMARKSVATAAQRIPWISNVYALPTQEFLEPLIHDDQKDPSEAMKRVAVWLGPIIEGRWDMIANWSFCETSSYLNALIPGRIKLGFSRRGDLSLSTVDGWSHYVQAVVQSGQPQNIHITDILTTQLLTALQIHVGDPSSNGDTPVTSRSFFSLQAHPSGHELLYSDSSYAMRKWVGIHLGASNPHARWNPENWAQLSSYILHRNPDWNVVLLGKKGEEVLANSFLGHLPEQYQNSPRILNLVGQTNFDQWADIMGQCQWVFAGDTASIHLASLLGTRILNIRNGSDSIENGPYGNGHYVVCGKPSAEAIYAVWNYACQEWIHRRHLSLQSHFTQLGWNKDFETVQVYRSTIRPSQDGGGATYESMKHSPIELNEWSAAVIGHIARSWYCGWVPPVCHEIPRERISASLIQKLRELNESCTVLDQICSKAISIADQLSSKGESLKSSNLMGLEDRNAIQELGDNLKELETLMDRLGKTHSPLQAFSQMSRVLMHNLKGQHIGELGKETATCYKRIRNGVQIFQEWIEKTLEMAKPVALPSGTVTHLEGPKS